VAARFDLGRAALARKDYAGAVRHLEATLALDRQAAIAHYPLAMAYRGLGDQTRAQAHLELRRRGDVDLPVVDPLMQELDELLESPEAYDVRGIRALDRKDWKAAVENFRKGIALAPNSGAMRHRLGTALFQLGDTAGATEQFREAVRVSPEYAKAHYSLGVLEAASGRDGGAIVHLSAAVRHDPEYMEARLQLAALLRRAGRFQESLVHYERISTSTPAIVEATFGYAMTLVGLQRYQEASERLTDGLKVHRGQPGLTHALARLLAAAPDARVRDGSRAMAVMQTLSEAERRMDLGETMAMTFAELGQYEQAVTWQREAVAAAGRAGREDLANGMTANLRLYEQRMACRTPWRRSELP
jgi:tetratricopeptide (TPR) repeat protein